MCKRTLRFNNSNHFVTMQCSHMRTSRVNRVRTRTIRSAVWALRIRASSFFSSCVNGTPPPLAAQAISATSYSTARTHDVTRKRRSAALRLFLLLPTLFCATPRSFPCARCIYPVLPHSNFLLPTPPCQACRHLTLTPAAASCAVPVLGSTVR